MEKTVKEIADELNVSKQKIMYHIKKLDEKKYQKKDNTIYINQSGIEEIYQKLKYKKTSSKKTPKSDSLVAKKYIDILEQQLIQKDKQLEENQKLLDQQQKLQLQSNQRIEKLEEQLTLGIHIKSQKEMSSTEQEKMDKGIEQLKKELEKANDEIDQHQAKLAEKEKQIEEDEKINKEWSESNEELEKENERLKMELEKVQSKKWFQFWK